MLAGCSKTVYVPIETVRTEYRNSESKDSLRITDKVNVKDSISIRDSIVMVLNENGDVVRTEIWRWRERYLNSDAMYKELKVKYDSLLFVRQDSIQVPYLVEKKLSKWNQFKVDYGGFIIGMIFITAGLIWILYRTKKK